VALILRPGKVPSGVEVRGHVRRFVRHLVRAIRRHWADDQDAHPRRLTPGKTRSIPPTPPET